MNNKVLIIGGGGYVGSVLVPYLLQLGYQVTVYDIFLYGKFLNNHNNLTIIDGDVRNLELISTHLKKNPTIIHLACISNDPGFELKPELSKSINFDFFEPLIKLITSTGKCRFIFASSSSVYGVKSQTSVTEDASLEPLTDYSKYKALCEEVLLKYESDNFFPVILRPSTVHGYSPRQRLDVVVNIMTNLGYHNNKITVFGGGQLRPNIYMIDMIRAYETILNADLKLVKGQIFNVGDENLTVNEIAIKVRDQLKNRVIINKTSTNDNRSYHVSSEKIVSKLGFKLHYKVEDGINSLIEAFEKKTLVNTFSNDLFYNIKVLSKSNLV